MTSCTITGLKNGDEYTFEVIAKNAVGDSDPSARRRRSPRCDPGPACGAERTSGDKQVALAWTAPTNDGTPITDYVVEISPPTGGVLSNPVPGGTTSRPGRVLTNGTAYRFRVQATNSKGSSDWSDYSADVTPVGLPLARFDGCDESGQDTGSSATVTWPAADGNGDPP